MNAQRRKVIEDLESQLDTLIHDVDLLVDEETEAYDNLPESMQDGDKGQAIGDAQTELISAKGSLQEAIDYLTAAREVTHG